LSSPHLTRLHTLDLSGNHGYGDLELDRLLRGDEGPLPSLRNLRRLSLCGGAVSDSGVRALADSPVPETPTPLDVSANTLTPESLRALIASPLWARLEELNLGFPFLEGAGFSLLVDALPRSRIARLGLEHPVFQGDPQPLALAE